MPTRSRIVAALSSRNDLTTCGVGSIRLSPVSTTKVRTAESSAMTTANGASHFRRDPLDSAGDGSNGATAEVSALVILAMRC